MEQIKHFFGLIVILIYLIHGKETMENSTEDTIILNRVRRIIRGHLAKPGQVVYILRQSRK